MAKATEKINRAQHVLTELHQIRATSSRNDAAARLKAIAADLDGNGADTEKAQAARAIAALSAAYERTGELVPDALWADAVNRTHAWASAEE
jgi:hypothetical protein